MEVESYQEKSARTVKEENNSITIKVENEIIVPKMFDVNGDGKISPDLSKRDSLMPPKKYGNMIRDQGRKHCRFFASQQGCIKGDSCDFLHYRSIGSAGESAVNLSFELVGHKIVKSSLDSNALSTNGSGKGDLTKGIRKEDNVGDCSRNKKVQEKGMKKTKSPLSQSEKLFVKFKPKDMCRYYLSPRGCDKGGSCHFLHQENRQNTPKNIASDRSLSSSDSYIDNPQNEKTSVARNKEKNIGENFRTNMVNEQEEKPSKKVCRFYNSGPGCREGKHCRFDHLNPQTEVNKKLDYEYEQNRKEAVFPEDNTNIQAFCKWYKSPRGCLKGDSCNFAHEQNFGQDKAYKVVENMQGGIINRPCKWFLSARGCLKEDNCDFVHDGTIPSNSRSQDDIEYNEVSIQNERVNIDSTGQHDAEGGVKYRDSKPLCRFYTMTSGCKKGNTCPFSHDQSTSPGISSADIEVRTNIGRQAVPQSLRQIEIDQLKRRYATLNQLITINDAEFIILANPTDPDWPFVVKEFQLRVTFPEDYPEQIFNIKLEDNDNYPPGFARYLTIDLENRSKEIQAESSGLPLRPFMKWFDKNLQNLFTSAATKVKYDMQAAAAGMQVMAPHEIRNSYSPGEKVDQVKEERSPLQPSASAKRSEANTQVENSELETVAEINQLVTCRNEATNTPIERLSGKVKKGTEVKFINMYLSEQVGTLKMKLISLTVQCERCKTRAELRINDKQTQSVTCKKCNSVLASSYYAEIVHQYSPVVGYLHLNGCRAFDLILAESNIILNCLQCSKDNQMKGIAYGRSKRDHWCIFCHQKLDVQIEATRFVQLQSAGGGAIKTKPVEPKKKNVKDPNIRAGEPLPENGTCKHYKKSYRWLRFPCCGKCYPCDICHEEKEENDHEMLFATRMVCGFCAKEQPYSGDKPCVACQSNLTRAKSSHWEGGKGCRDQTKMAKGDNQKTAGLGKTISRKKQAELDQHKKKK